jgi:hypothetical protein
MGKQLHTHTHQLVLHDTLLFDFVEERLVADAE